MTRLAMLGSNVRLVAIQFLMKPEYVPGVVSKKQPTYKPENLMPISGKEVLSSTKDVYLLNLFDGICPGDDSGSYELVDAWFGGRLIGKNWMAAVRYVFCHRDHVQRDELFPEFVKKRDELIDSLLRLADQNLWAVQGHLNPYFDTKTWRSTGHQVLMLGCAGRFFIEDDLGMKVRVWSGGRDKLGQGVGEKVPITATRPWLKVREGEVVLEYPQPVQPETVNTAV